MQELKLMMKWSAIVNLEEKNIQNQEVRKRELDFKVQINYILRVGRKKHFKKESEMSIKMMIWVSQWIASWMDMICGLLSIVTFCAYRPGWDMTIRCYFSKLILKMKQNKI